MGPCYHVRRISGLFTLAAIHEVESILLAKFKGVAISLRDQWKTLRSPWDFTSMNLSCWIEFTEANDTMS